MITGLRRLQAEVRGTGCQSVVAAHKPVRTPATVTVVVPNYNHARYLPQSLGSIAAQTLAADEVIVIDDGSCDESIEVIESFTVKRANWRLIRNEQRMGVIARLNDGLAEARGNWVLFLGADDFLLPRLIERAVDQAEEAPHSGLVCACVAVVRGTSKSAARPTILPHTQPGYVSAARFRELLRFSDNFFHGTVSLYNRHALLALGGFNPTLGALADGFAARRLAARFGFGFVPQVLGCWRQHDGSLSVDLAKYGSDTEGLLLCAREILAKEPVGVFPSDYPAKLEQRLRFGWARLLVLDSRVPPTPKAASISEILGAGRVEGGVIRMILRLRRPGELGALAWIALRFRPFSLVRLAFEPLRRALMVPLLSAAKHVDRPSAPSCVCRPPGARGQYDV